MVSKRTQKKSRSKTGFFCFALIFISDNRDSRAVPGLILTMSISSKILQEFEGKLILRERVLENVLQILKVYKSPYKLSKPWFTYLNVILILRERVLENPTSNFKLIWKSL